MFVHVYVLCSIGPRDLKESVYMYVTSMYIHVQVGRENHEHMAMG